MTSATGLRALTVATGVSTFGTRMSLLAVPWFVLATTGSASRTGLIAFVETLPYVMVQAVGGPAVDRLGLRRVSVGSDVLAGMTFAAVPMLHLLGDLNLVVLGILVALCGLFRSAGDTARSVLVPQVTVAAGAPLERGAGLHDGASRLAGLVGAPVAGALLAVWTGPSVLALDAGTFVVSAALVGLFVPRRGPSAESAPATSEPAGGYLASLREGFAHLGVDRILLAIGLTVLVTNLLDQAYSSVLAPVWVRQVSGSSVALGVLGGVFGVGAVLGNLVLAWLGPRLPRRRAFAWSYLVAGGPRFVAMALLSAVAPVVAISFVSGFAAGSLNPLLGAVQYERIPEALQARVLGAVNALAWAGIPLGSLLGGLAVAHLGFRATLAVAGGVYLLVTVLPLVLPVWRDLDRERVPAAG